MYLIKLTCICLIPFIIDSLLTLPAIAHEELVLVDIAPVTLRRASAAEVLAQMRKFQTRLDSLRGKNISVDR